MELIDEVLIENIDYAAKETVYSQLAQLINAGSCPASV